MLIKNSREESGGSCDIKETHLGFLHPWYHFFVVHLSPTDNIYFLKSSGMREAKSFSSAKTKNAPKLAKISF